MDYLYFIQENLSQAALWGQLAEECTELAQAALKKQRLLMRENPPRKTEKEIDQAIMEEIADIDICLNVLDVFLKEEECYTKAIQTKPARWAAIIDTAKLAEERGVRRVSDDI